MSPDERAPSPPVSSCQDGPSLGGYRLLKVLGKGGLGEVYEALAPNDERVALKAFALRDDDQGLIASTFRREANIGLRLVHPDIVRVLDSGSQGDYAYLVMELGPGHDLRRHTEPDQLLPLPQVLRTLERVARALGAAHALGVIHRDIKPANVRVDWPTDLVKVTDFGMAKAGDAFRSRTGIMVGTPGYMAPEQLAESALTPACDLYALGVLAFELLTARLPHPAASLGELLRLVANQPAPDVRTFRRDVPAGIAHVVADLLERRPERRPQGAVVLADRLASLRGSLHTDTDGSSPRHGDGPMSRP